METKTGSKWWKPDDEQKLDLYQKGYGEACFIAMSLTEKSIKELARFSLAEFGSDPRTIPSIVGNVYKQMISRNALGFVNHKSKLLPSEFMLAYFSGFERCLLMIHEANEKNRVKVKKQKRKQVNRQNYLKRRIGK